MKDAKRDKLEESLDMAAHLVETRGFIDGDEFCEFCIVNRKAMEDLFYLLLNLELVQPGFDKIELHFGENTHSQ